MFTGDAKDFRFVFHQQNALAKLTFVANKANTQLLSSTPFGENPPIRIYFFIR